MVRDVMPNGVHSGGRERQPAWRNRKIIAAGAGVAAVAVAGVVIALAATGNGAPQPNPHAAPPVTASTAAPQGQPSSALASPPQARPTATPGVAANAPGGSTHTALVTQAELGPDWPLTVSSGWVRCVAHSNAYTFRTAGSGARTYALNLAALKLGYPSITAIQIQSQDGTGEPADVSPLQERAANLC
jgi:hypothetical protein